MHTDVRSQEPATCEASTAVTYKLVLSLHKFLCIHCWMLFALSTTIRIRRQEVIVAIYNKFALDACLKMAAYIC